MGSREPYLAVYLATALATMALTAAELLLVHAGVPGGRALLVPLILAGFGLAALFYQGLRYQSPAYGGIFVAGLVFGLLTFSGLVGLLGLGTVVRP